MPDMWKWIAEAWNWLEEAQGPLTILLAVGGAIGGVAGFLWGRKNSKKKAVDDLVAQLHQGATDEARSTIESFWASEEGKRIQLDSEDYNQLIESALVSATKHEHDRHLHRLLSHYREVVMCVRSGNCDAGYACAKYGDGMRKFLLLYYRWLEINSAIRRENLSAPIEAFLRQFCHREMEEVRKQGRWRLKPSGAMRRLATVTRRIWPLRRAALTVGSRRP